MTMPDEETEDEDSSGFISPARIASVVATAKLAGKQAAMPVIQRVLREQVVRLMRNHDPDKLRRFIDVQYPLIDEEMPDNYKTALGNAGPTFEQEIKQVLSPAQVKSWFTDPDSWMDEADDPEAFADVAEIGEILTTHPDADEWLARQILTVYQICNID